MVKAEQNTKEKLDDWLMVRIDSEMKDQFTKINKKSNKKNSIEVRNMIKEYIQENEQ